MRGLPPAIPAAQGLSLVSDILTLTGINLNLLGGKLAVGWWWGTGFGSRLKAGRDERWRDLVAGCRGILFHFRKILLVLRAGRSLRLVVLASRVARCLASSSKVVSYSFDFGFILDDRPTVGSGSEGIDPRRRVLLPARARFKTRLCRMSFVMRQYFQPSPGYQYWYLGIGEQRSSYGTRSIIAPLLPNTRVLFRLEEAAPKGIKSATNFHPQTRF